MGDLFVFPVLPRPRSQAPSQRPSHCCVVKGANPCSLQLPCSPRQAMDLVSDQPAGPRRQRSEEEDEPGGRNARNKKRQTHSLLAPRSRAATACQFCRLRKTKCDNVRPTCGFCRRHRANCVYAQELCDAPFYDEASREILARLDQITAILAKTAAVAEQDGPPSAGADAAVDFQPAEQDARRMLLCSRPDLPAAAAAAAFEASKRARLGGDPGRRRQRLVGKTACESLLDWPVFRAILSHDETRVQFFLLDARPEDLGAEAALARPEPRQRRHGIEEASFVPLTRKFLAHVHPRNPILNVAALLQSAKEITEEGLGWDSRCCLLVRVQGKTKAQDQVADGS